MGKNKKPQKTKELSVAIAEASSTGDPETTQQQPQTPRKRGRPRKIIEKSESAVEKEESTAEGAEATHEQGFLIKLLLFLLKLLDYLDSFTLSSEFMEQKGLKGSSSALICCSYQLIIVHL
ncbi:hypothetical protein POTOM_009155 [Populus tomentosa]|uniref:Uncharacterized protein n=1 Tax=Populus tomentosa TaxID=118781 RepID=A0A8X8AFQ3_POPTO|nr:hypothetical protein POTOM_009155 [Populus tomentosa]